MNKFETLMTAAVDAAFALKADKAQTVESRKAYAAAERALLWAAFDDAETDFAAIVETLLTETEASDNVRKQYRFRAARAVEFRSTVAKEAKREKQSPLTVAKAIYERQTAAREAVEARMEVEMRHGEAAVRAVADATGRSEAQVNAALRAGCADTRAQYDAALDDAKARADVLGDALRLLDVLNGCDDAVKGAVFAAFGEAAAVFAASVEAKAA